MVRSGTPRAKGGSAGDVNVLAHLLTHLPLCDGAIENTSIRVVDSVNINSTATGDAAKNNRTFAQHTSFSSTRSRVFHAVKKC